MASNTVKALFSTICAACEQAIEIGSLVTFDEETSGWVHTDTCLDEPLPDTANTLCVQCYLYHAGPCD